MSRRGVWIAVLIVGGLFMVSAAAQQSENQSRQPVRAIQPVTENLYVIPGSDRNTYAIGDYVPDDSVRTRTTGGNTAVWVTAQGVVLVDTMNPGSGAEILAQVRSVTDKPITTVINTHTHFDHSGSNPELSDAVQFVAHENIRAAMALATCDPVLNCQAFQGENAKFLPTTTFSERMTLFDGADRIELHHLGRGHTNGDTFVVFPSAGAMHTGDMFQRKNMPFVDAENGGGDAREFSDTLNRAVATIGGVDTVIAGHSPTLLAWSDFVEYTEYYGEFVASVLASKDAGRSVDEAARAYAPSTRFQSYETDRGRVAQNAASIYASGQ